MKLVGLLLVVGLFFPNSVHGDCIPAGTANNDPLNPKDGISPSDRKVYIYIESDFHVEMRESTPSSDDNSMTFEQVRNLIMQSAESWNVQTRAAALHFGGTFNYDDAGLPVRTFCDDVNPPPNSIAIYVQYIDDYHAWNTGSAHVYAIDNSYAPCEDHLEMTVYERPADSQSGQTPFRWDWKFGSQAEYCCTSSCDIWSQTCPRRLRMALTHEFGHVIGIGHENGPEFSVMDSTSGHYLQNWDKDCATEYSSGKLSRPVSMNFDSNGFLKSVNVASGTAKTGTAFYNGSLTHPNTTAKYITRYRGSHVDWATQDTDGFRSWSTVSAIGASSSDIKNLDVAPHFFSRQESSSNPNGAMISFTDDENDSNPSTQYDPPYAQFHRASSVTFAPTPYTTDESFRVCSNVSCSSYSSARTHLPLTTAYDPISNRTVVSMIDTETAGWGDGYFTIHPGFYAWNKVRYGTSPYTQVNLPSIPGEDYSYRHSTLQPLSIACGDSTYDYYNCLVAWTDRGKYDGSVLVAHFRINGNSILWDSVGYTMFGSDTYRAPATAFFNDELHVAWVDENDVVTIKKSSVKGQWSTKFTFTAVDLVSGLSFAYKDGGEASLIYYQSL